MRVMVKSWGLGNCHEARSTNHESCQGLEDSFPVSENSLGGFWNDHLVQLSNLEPDRQRPVADHRPGEVFEGQGFDLIPILLRVDSLWSSLTALLNHGTYMMSSPLPGDRGCSAAVKHSARDHEVEGSNPACQSFLL